MIILAVDTSTTSCSVAVIDEDSLLAEATIVREQTHSKHLMDMVDSVVTLAGLSISELDGFAVTRGPGTFTGLRIGISTVKGLAVASGKPVVGISSLDALAKQCAYSSNLVCPLIDARKGEVYFARYRFSDGVLEKVTAEGVLPPAQAVSDITEPALFVGSGAVLYQEILLKKVGEQAYFAMSCHNTIRASTVARLGMGRFEQKDTDDVGMLVPDYIRQSDAELKLQRLSK
jgi:tRNA threonylcarbamoyladenosine biosynthesis protein TsaB